MEPAQELRDLCAQLKRWVWMHRESGFEPPPVPRRARAGQEPEEARGAAGGAVRSLSELRSAIGECRRCKLWEGRRNLVFGEGSETARLMFVGEGPGREEDEAGRPFVGEAGRMLTRIIENGMGLKREEVFICNVVKCRPPRNRDPEPGETGECLPFLREQIRIVGPEVICALGRVAGEALLGPGFRVTRQRGEWHRFMDIPLLATFHPAYLLRNPAAKRAVWDDVKEIMRALDLEIKHG